MIDKRVGGWTPPPSITHSSTAVISHFLSIPLRFGVDDFVLSQVVWSKGQTKSSLNFICLSLQADIAGLVSNVIRSLLCMLNCLKLYTKTSREIFVSKIFTLKQLLQFRSTSSMVSMVTLSMILYIALHLRATLNPRFIEALG